MESIAPTITTAFESRHYPGDNNITRCKYDKRNGGAYDEPCWECQEMAEFFKAKSWRELKGQELRRYGDNDGLFTVEAYCFFLPGYLIAAIHEPEDLDVCRDHLTYRFGPMPDDLRGQHRLGEICTELTRPEIEALLCYFQFAFRKDQDFDSYCERSIKNLEYALSVRSNP
ncbi:MAG: hypothetical protein EXR70_01130 [Deltaproteobacteria bacterium]|nr:hypothetical protein [Deltaproteobacteria bacterium]